MATNPVGTGQTGQTGSPDVPVLRKRAVVVIHGIGNQSPMTTLRSLVEAVWTSAPGLTKPGVRPQTWAKRDLMSDSYELRRITTNDDTKDRRTDFFEFYWADMMEDTKLSSVIWWIKRILGRGTSRVPPAVWKAWIAGHATIFLLIVVLIGLALMLLKVLWTLSFSFWWAAAWLAGAAVVAVILWYLRHRVLVEVAGDAARYLTADPQNIAARSRIRTAGLKLLTALHESPDYDRIIIVCHSLGTVIGYDLLNFYWSTVNGYFRHPEDCEELKALAACIEKLHKNPDDAEAFDAFREAQRKYARVVCGIVVEDGPERMKKTKWKVTDFVTLGSPLTHAHFLMVDDRASLLASDDELIGDKNLWLTAWRERLDAITGQVARVFLTRAAQREFPLCPPLNEKDHAFAYASDGRLIPHHAAVFAPVRWTNIFAPCRSVFWGDVVGGPVRLIFGPGVKDVPLTGAVGRRRFAHTHYWDPAGKEPTNDQTEHLDALRAALNFLDQPEGDAWAQHRMVARAAI